MINFDPNYLLGDKCTYLPTVVQRKWLLIIMLIADAQNLHFPPESTFFFEPVEIWQRLELIANLTTLVNFSKTEYAINCQVHI